MSEKRKVNKPMGTVLTVHYKDGSIRKIRPLESVSEKFLYGDWMILAKGVSVGQQIEKIHIS